MLAQGQFCSPKKHILKKKNASSLFITVSESDPVSLSSCLHNRTALSQLAELASYNVEPNAIDQPTSRGSILALRDKSPERAVFKMLRRNPKSTSLGMGFAENREGSARHKLRWSLILFQRQTNSRELGTSPHNPSFLFENLTRRNEALGFQFGRGGSLWQEGGWGRLAKL